MSGFPNNFGKRFAETGKFGQKNRRKIKKKFGSVNNFLEQAGVNRGSRVGRGSIQNSLQSTFSGGPQPNQPTQPPAPVAPPTPTPQQPNQDPVQNQQGNLASGLLQQGTDLSNVGANILDQGNPASNPLLNAGSNFQQGSITDFGKVNTAVGNARNLGQQSLSTIADQQLAADQDIQNLFNAQPLDTLRSNISALNTANQASGLSNSRSGNELSAELQRGLIRDQAQARLGSNNQFRQATLNELNNQRGLESGVANLFSGQGIGQGQLGNQALSQGGNLVNATNQLGANIFNQGFQNQLQGLGFINNAAQQNFQTQNQLLQQALANIQGARSNRQANQFRQEQLDLLKDAQGGGGFLSGALGGLGGALGGLF